MQFCLKKGEFLMRTVPKDLHIHISKYDCKTEIGEVCLQIRIKDDTGHETVSRTIGYDRVGHRWILYDNKTVREVSEQWVYEELLDAYKSSVSVEDLVTANIEAIRSIFNMEKKRTGKNA